MEAEDPNSLEEQKQFELENDEQNDQDETQQD
jgi:hypothetical protein